MHSFYEQKDYLIQSIENVFENKKELCEKNNKDSSYIDPEFFDDEDQEEKILCEQIQKRLHVLCKNLTKSICDVFEDEENKLAFQVFKNAQTPYESICYLYGYFIEDDADKKFKLPKGKIPNYIDDPTTFFLVVDTKNGPNLLPWSK